MIAFLLRLAGTAVIAVGLAAGIAARPAAAASLRADVVVDGPIVTLGDLFEGAGPLADQPVFRAPDPGVNGALPAAAALEAARAAGLSVDPSPIENVRVQRASLRLTPETFETAVRDAVVERLGRTPDDVSVLFDAAAPDLAVPAEVGEPLTLAQLDVQPYTGRFAARFVVDRGSDRLTVDVRGRAVETMRVPVLTRPVDRRQVIGTADVVFQRVERRRVTAGTLLEPDEVAGMAARRPLRAGDPLLATDLEKPRLVLRGEQVTLSYVRPGLTLSVRGRALSDGAAGDLVSVLNEQSRRTVEGVVSGPGRVSVGGVPAVVAEVATQ